MKKLILLAALAVAPAFAQETTIVQIKPDRPVFDQPEMYFSRPGVVGMMTDNATSQIMRIFPGSDLNKFGVQTGDAVLQVNGINYRSDALTRACAGPVGSKIILTIRRGDGNIIRCQVARKDPRMFGAVDYARDVRNQGYYHQDLGGW